MNLKVLLIHARNQIRTVWLMSGRRFASPYEIQTRNPSLGLSFAALLLAYGLYAIHDYFYYPVDLLAGLIPQDMPQATYMAVYAASYLLGSALAYGALFLLAIPLGYTTRFWHGLIALNWWSLMVAFAIFPLLLFSLVLADDDPFLSPLIALIFLIFIVIVFKSFQLIRHALRTTSAKAALLTLVSIIAQITAMVLVTRLVGISLV